MVHNKQLSGLLIADNIVGVAESKPALQNLLDIVYNNQKVHSNTFHVGMGQVQMHSHLTRPYMESTTVYFLINKVKITTQKKTNSSCIRLVFLCCNLYLVSVFFHLHPYMQRFFTLRGKIFL